MTLTLIPIYLRLNYLIESEDEDIKSDVVVSSTLKTRNGRQIKAVVRLNLLDLLKEAYIRLPRYSVQGH